VILPAIRVQTWERVCVEGNIDDIDTLVKNLSSEIIHLRESNFYVYQLLSSVLFGHTPTESMKKARVVATKAAMDVYKMFEIDSYVPVICESVYETVIQSRGESEKEIYEFAKRDPLVFDVCTVAALPFSTNHRYEETHLVINTTCLLYRMFGLQAEYQLVGV
jgi:hypothetical protein